MTFRSDTIFLRKAIRFLWDLHSSYNNWICSFISLYTNSMYVENRAEITTILEGLQIFVGKSFGSYGIHIAQFRTYVCSFTKSSFVAIG